MVSAAIVKELRDKTGAGMMDCKRALVESGGDIEKAIDYLRKAGVAKADKKSSRQASDGVITSYIHPGAKLGVLLEINCETDFVAKTPDFQAFAKDVAMHIAAVDPQVVKREEISEALLNREREIYMDQARQTGKPENILEKIVSGRVEKFYGESVLLEQTFVKDPQKTVGDLLKETILTLGENIVITRFERFQLGQNSQN